LMSNKNTDGDRKQPSANSKANKEEAHDPTQPAPDIKSPSIPKVTTPKACKDLEKIVKTTASVDFDTTVGEEIKTQDNSTAHRCRYSKNGKYASISLYEYEAPEAAARGVSELSLPGYVTKQKGVMVMSVVVASETLDASATKKVADAVMEQL